MDELGWSWPAWKFGMKREDLGTKLHEQYNTFPSAIQDPEAFHHDVFEISSKAATTDEFHRLMAARTQERLQELSDSLESAAFEIIAHPKLVGTEQWQYALQLFRTRSLDSLVRYFSSYLPDHHYPSASGYQTPPSAASSFAEVSSVATASTKNSSVDDNHVVAVDGHDAVLVASPELLPEDDDGKACFTREPPALDECISFSLDSKIPLSPRSMTAKSEDDATKAPSTISSEDVACRDFALHTHTTIRTMSFSGSEADSLPALSKSVSDDDETSQSEEDDSPAVSQPDLMDSRSSLDSIGFSGSESGGLRRSHHQKKPDYYNDNDDDDEDIPTAQMPADSFFADDFETVQMPPLESCESMEESEAPTPRLDGPAAATTCYLDSQASFHQHHATRRIRSPHRSVSPKAARHNRRDAVASPSASRRGGAGGLAGGSSSGGVCGVARSPDEVFSRVQKAPLSDPARIRTVLKGRTRAE